MPSQHLLALGLKLIPRHHGHAGPGDDLMQFSGGVDLMSRHIRGDGRGHAPHRNDFLEKGPSLPANRSSSLIAFKSSFMSSAN